MGWGAHVIHGNAQKGYCSSREMYAFRTVLKQVVNSHAKEGEQTIGGESGRRTTTMNVYSWNDNVMCGRGGSSTVAKSLNETFRRMGFKVVKSKK